MHPPLAMKASRLYVEESSLGSETIGFGFVLQPFVGAIFWACALTVIFYPMYQKFLQKMPGRKNTASLFTLICLLLIVAPVLPLDM